MIEIKLQQIPNQSLSIDIGDSVFDLVLSTTGVTVMDIFIDGVLKIASAKCVPFQPIISYKYLEKGNFFFTTENEEYPDYTKFSVTHKLFYFDETEMAAYHAG